MGIYSLIPGKQEHSRGLLMYSLSQRLLKSRLPIVLESQPRLPGYKLTPAQSMYNCIQRLRSGSTDLHHIIADSAFAATKSIEELPTLYNTVATISVNGSPQSGLASVYSFMGQDLRQGHARLFQSETMLIEIVQRGSYTNAIATNAFRPKLASSLPQPATISVEPSNVAGSSAPNNEDIQQLPVRLSYQTAIALWENENIVTLKQLFGLDNSFASHDKVEIILAGTGMPFYINIELY